MASINGFSCCPGTGSGPQHIKTYRVPTGTNGPKIYLPVRREIAPLLIGAAAEFHRYVERLEEGWNWGYACRRIGNSNSWSFHAPGIAMDLNAPEHPYGKRNTFGSADRDRCRRIAKKYGLRWGGDYSTPDDMHFEVILRRSDALDRVEHIRAVNLGTLRRGAERHAVLVMKRNLKRRGFGRDVNVESDHFGSAAYNELRRFQKSRGLQADGVCGYKTWRALL